MRRFLGVLWLAVALAGCVAPVAGVPVFEPTAKGLVEQTETTPSGALRVFLADGTQLVWDDSVQSSHSAAFMPREDFLLLHGQAPDGPWFLSVSYDDTYDCYSFPGPGQDDGDYVVLDAGFGGGAYLRLRKADGFDEGSGPDPQGRYERHLGDGWCLNELGEVTSYRN